MLLLILKTNEGKYLDRFFTSNSLKIRLMCLKQPSAISMSSWKVLPLKSGWGAFSKNLLNGKNSFTFSTYKTNTRVAIKWCDRAFKFTK